MQLELHHRTSAPRRSASARGGGGGGSPSQRLTKHAKSTRARIIKAGRTESSRALLTL